MRGQFRKQGEVAVSGQQRLNTVPNAPCRDARIVIHSCDDVRPVHESLQNLQEIVGFADHAVRR